MTELTLFNKFLNLESDNISSSINDFLSVNASNIGISEFNIEKILQSAIPDISIKSLEIHENSNLFKVFLTLSYKFDFNTELTSEYIHKYYKISLKRFNFKDSNIVNLLKSYNFEKLSHNKEIVKDFSNSNISQISNFFKYDIDFYDEFYRDDFTYYLIQTFFDFEQFSKDYDIELLDFPKKINGKFLILQILNNKNIQTSTYSHYSNFGNNFQGVVNIDTSGKRYSYSTKTIDSFEVFLREINISNISKVYNDNIVDIQFFNEFSTLQPLKIKTLKVPRINVHEFSAISSPIQVLFDVDFVGIVKDFSKYKNLITKTPNIANKCYISSVRIERKRVDKKDSESILMGEYFSQDLKSVNFENEKITLKEVSYELTEKNNGVKSFILLDKTFENQKIEGEHQYSVKIEIIDKIYDFLKENFRKLSELESNLNKLQLYKSGKIVDAKNVSYYEDLHINTLKEFFDTLSIFKTVNNDDILNVYNVSNVYDGTVSGILKLISDVRTLKTTINNITLDTEVSSLFKKSKTFKQKIVYNYNFTRIFNLNKTGVSFVDPSLIVENEVKNSQIIRLKPENILKIENLEPFEVRSNNKPEINLKDRMDSEFVLKTGILKGANFVDKTENKAMISNLRDEFLGNSLTISLKPPNLDNFSNSDKVESVSTTFKNEEHENLSKNVIFDQDLNNLNISKVFKKLKPSNVEKNLSNIEYFSGYKVSEDGEVKIKEPIWKKYDKNVENMSILCRFQSVNSGIGILNKYFVLNDIKQIFQNSNLESVDLKVLESLNNSKKLEYFKGFEQ